MANSLTPSILVILFQFSATLAGRVKLHSASHRDGTSKITPDDDYSICESMVAPQGYVCQEHTVTTEDGYILGMQRMSVSRSGKKAEKPPVLLQHGIYSDGVVWLYNSPSESLPFILVDNGFDVWIANSRGTRSSQGHKSLSPDDWAYWEWSWDELAAYDLPAALQYVHDQAGQKVHYVGHSLGTLIAFAALSQGKILNVLRSAALLCPIAHFDHIPSLATRAAADLLLAQALYWLGIHEYLPNGLAASKLLEQACKITGIACSDLTVAFVGANCCVNSSRINIFLEHEPQPTSTKNMIHLSQMIKTGSIAMYDYGNVVDNMNHYQQPTPPVYNMKNIPNDLPLYLAYGGRDMLADVDDVQILLGNLKDHSKDKLVAQYVEEYAHADFILGENANQVVYDPIMTFFGHN